VVLIGFLRVRSSCLQAFWGPWGFSGSVCKVPWGSPICSAGRSGVPGLVLRQAGVCSGPSAEALGVLIRVLLKALRFSKVFC